LSWTGTSKRRHPRYRLKRLSADEFALFAEFWQMWRRWEDACHRGEILGSTPPVLPVDRGRHDDIEPMVKKALAVPEHADHVARGMFRASPRADEERDGRWDGLEVEWTPV
jgi:hypothetical protein